MFRRIGKNDPCWCGSGKPYCECHMTFDQKISRARFAGHEVPSHKIIKTPAQIEGIRESGKLNVAVLDYVAEHIREGITTEEIDQWVYDFTTKHGGIPAPLNYEVHCYILRWDRIFIHRFPSQTDIITIWMC